MHHWGLGIGNVTYQAGKCFCCMLYCQLHCLVPTKIHYLVRSVYLFTYCSPMPKDTTRSGTSSHALRHLEQHHAIQAECERSRSWRHGSADSTREPVQTTQEPQVGQKNWMNSRSNIVWSWRRSRRTWRPLNIQSRKNQMSQNQISSSEEKKETVQAEPEHVGQT